MNLFNRFKNWKGSLSPLKRLFVSFVIFWFFNLILHVVIFHFMPRIDYSLSYHLVYTFFLTILFTLLFKWKELKDVFKRQSTQ
ncbi:hypothetical protein HNQ92_004726 [Rhabdobacter roseus]|uniref:Uncharacterized protein n=1 Tax=Rhabdobacter roseus TaxID=1655419 RepID=A0A840TUI0_9BACT|nr:hypothetical protein [Rhabdobacter roseus]